MKEWEKEMLKIEQDYLAQREISYRRRLARKRNARQRKRTMQKIVSVTLMAVTLSVFVASIVFTRATNSSASEPTEMVTESENRETIELTVIENYDAEGLFTENNVECLVRMPDGSVEGYGLYLEGYRMGESVKSITVYADNYEYAGSWEKCEIKRMGEF